MLVNGGMDWLLGILRVGSGSPLAFLGIGDSPNIVSADQIQLINELSRKAITNIYEDSGTIVCETSIDYAEANFIWREMGLFAGGNGSPNTGIMVARGLVSEDKDERRMAMVIWQLKFNRS